LCCDAWGFRFPTWLDHMRNYPTCVCLTVCIVSGIIAIKGKRYAQTDEVAEDGGEILMPRGGYRPGAGAKPLPPGQRTRIISVTLRPSTLSRLDAVAQAQGRSRSAILNELINEHLRLEVGVENA
jgi:hypothetical protein